MKCECANCGKTVDHKPYLIKKSKSGRQYCSSICLGKWNARTTIDVPCSQCGKPVPKRRWRRQRFKNLFCSKPCHGKWARIHRRGKNVSSWKGGRFHTNEGYILVQAIGHPNANKSGYVQEHRLVVEQRLGRHLSKSEIVHHLNGVRDDNRPENLKVVSRSSHEINTVQKILQRRIIELEIEVKRLRVDAASKVISVG